MENIHAFPFVNQPSASGAEGMSLLDSIAMQALPGILASVVGKNDDELDGSSDKWNSAVWRAYQVAWVALGVRMFYMRKKIESVDEALIEDCTKEFLKGKGYTDMGDVMRDYYSGNKKLKDIHKICPQTGNQSVEDGNLNIVSIDLFGYCPNPFGSFFIDKSDVESMRDGIDKRSL